MGGFSRRPATWPCSTHVGVCPGLLLAGTAGRIPDPELTQAGRRQAAATGRFFGRLRELGTAPEHIIASPMLRALQTARPIVDATKPAGSGAVLSWPEACESGGVFGRDGAEPEGRPCHELTRAEVERALPGVACHDSITERGWWAPGRKETKDETTVRCMAVCRVLRRWAEAGAVELPGTADFAAVRTRMEARLGALREGRAPPTEADSDPASAGEVDADVDAARRALPPKGGEGSHPTAVASAAVVCHHDFIDRVVALLTHGGDPPPTGELYAPEPTLHFCFNNCSVSVLDLYPGGTTRVIRLNDVRHLDPVYARRRGLLSGFWQDVVLSPPEEWDGPEGDEPEGPEEEDARAAP